MSSPAVFLLCVLMGTLSVAAPQRTLRTGTLNEYVQSESSPGQRFTIYLPPRFNPSRPAPIIYLMDPRGRARVPAKLFLLAAERYGYILISSHDTSSDGPVEPSLRAMQAMWDDTHAWFSIDPNRTYVAGFSGTARTASLLAATRPAFTGMIGAGAGFHPAVTAEAGIRFLYYGAVGEADYNFHELDALEQTLADGGAAHRMERFPGPHAWMPPGVALRAVEWLELRAMQAGHRPADTALIETWWNRDEAVARAHVEAGNVLDGARHYAAMARDFAGLRDIAGVGRAAATIASSSVAQEQLTRRRALSRGWIEAVEDDRRIIARAFPEGETVPAVGPDELSRLLRLAALKRAAARDVPEALEARRRLNHLEVQLGFYLPHDAMARSDFERASYYLALAREIDGASPVSWYLTAQAAARRQRTGEALAALERAVEHGFRDLPLLEADGSFAKLRAHPAYAALAGFLASDGDRHDALYVDRPPVAVLR